MQSYDPNIRAPLKAPPISSFHQEQSTEPTAKEKIDDLFGKMRLEMALFTAGQTDPSFIVNGTRIEYKNLNIAINEPLSDPADAALKWSQCLWVALGSPGDTSPLSVNGIGIFRKDDLAIEGFTNRINKLGGESIVSSRFRMVDVICPVSRSSQTGSDFFDALSEVITDLTELCRLNLFTDSSQEIQKLKSILNWSPDLQISVVAAYYDQIGHKVTAKK